MLEFVARSELNKDRVIRGSYKTNEPKELMDRLKEDLTRAANKGKVIHGEKFRTAVSRAGNILDEWTVVAKPPRGSKVEILPFRKREEKKVILRKKVN